MSQDPSSPATTTPTEERSRPVDGSPGVLRGSATLTLQTRHAVRLVKGRSYSAEKPAIIGLLGFANLVRTVWHGARDDDPYADWWLLQVHDTLVQAELELAVLERALSARLEALSAIDVGAPESARPARIALNFSNPYAFRAAGLIGQFDGFACKVLSARHVGLIGRDESEKLLHQGGRWVRRALQSPVLYRLLGVTRDDVLQRTAKGLQAKETMGEVPDDVLRGDRRAPHAPAVVTQRESGMTEAVRLQPLRYGR